MILRTSLECQMFDRGQKNVRKRSYVGGRYAAAWVKDIRDCALVACGFTGLATVGMCLLAHPLLLTGLVVLGAAKWWEVRGRTLQACVPSPDACGLPKKV